MVTWLLDTNIVSELARAEPDEGVMKQVRRHEAELAIAAPVWHELRYGWLRLPDGRRKDAVGAFLQQVVTPLPVLPYDEAAARVHAEWRAVLDAAGKTLPFVDGQIAAIAAGSGLTLVTRNVKDFGAVPGLRVVNWFER
jgi:tRNA(fMet)-specific endonuclease VapC